MLRIVFLLVFAIFWASSFGHGGQGEQGEQNSKTYATTDDLVSLYKDDSALRRKLEGLESKLNSMIDELQLKMQAAERSLNSKIYQQQRNLQVLRSSGRITCDSVEDDYTNWQTGSHYSNRFLDRHHVICGTDEFLIGFKLQTRGSNEMRYAYQCCTIRIN